MDNNPSGNRHVSQSSPEFRTHRMDMYKEKEIYFKELAHVIMGAGNFKICRLIG